MNKYTAKYLRGFRKVADAPINTDPIEYRPQYPVSRAVGSAAAQTADVTANTLGSAINKGVSLAGRGLTAIGHGIKAIPGAFEATGDAIGYGIGRAAYAPINTANAVNTKSQLNNMAQQSSTKLNENSLKATGAAEQNKFLGSQPNVPQSAVAAGSHHVKAQQAGIAHNTNVTLPKLQSTAANAPSF